MRIEDEIKQPHFKSEHQKVIINLAYTSHWFESKISLRLKEFGISPQQFNILRILRGQHPKPATIQLLTERMLDKMSNASRLVEKLRQKHFVDRRECPNDRRAVDVLITEKGLKLLKDLDEVEKSLIDTIKHLNHDEAAQLNTLLDKLRN